LSTRVLAYIVHRVEDVTGFVRMREQESRRKAVADDLLIDVRRSST
jgi:hypothetical protein